jgi:hypothetical protein
MSNNDLKAEPPAKTESAGGSSRPETGLNGDAKYLYSTTNRQRCLPPQEAALAQLDSIEQRLAARAAGDDDALGRYYLAWLALHSLAFSYGRWAKEAG